MQINIVSAFHGPQSALIQYRGGSLPEGVIPCHPLESHASSSSSSSIIVNEIPPSYCSAAKDVTKPLKQLCEGKLSCDVSPDQFASNQTLCRGVSNEMLIAYRCEPSVSMIHNRVICQDTYMEIKCATYGSGESIVVLDAQLVMEVDPKFCQNIVEPVSSAGVCPSQLEVTAGLVEMCGRERTCSVMPDAAMLPPSYPPLCARRHLRLSYACVPPNVLETDRKASGKHLSRQSKTRHQHQKKNRREQNLVHSSRPAIPPSYQQEQRDPGAYMSPMKNELERVAYSAFMDETVQPKITSSTESPQPIKLLPGNVSMFSMVLGVIVGLAVLIVVIILLIAFGFRTRRQRAAYAERKALSDQAATDNTTLSDAEKIPKQQQLQPTPLNPQLNTANSFGYHSSSENGAASGIASTYMPHAMFTSENCWPTGLQPVPPGGNYFDDEIQGVAFPSIGRDSGSQGYVQLPISHSHHSGMVYSHQSSTTTMNLSNNHLLPYQMSHNCGPSDNFSVGPRVCSPAVNSTVSTESDRFSGHASSHPSSFQPLCPNNGGNCTFRQKSPQNQPLWMGYDEGPAPTPIENSNHAHSANNIADIPPTAISFESLIEPPDSFKNRPPSSGMPMEAVPPRMAQLRRMEMSDSGTGDWIRQDGGFAES
ncbi:hypothetical protein Aperf_G00000087335 [Anoplocephala perfoliata]